MRQERIGSSLRKVALLIAVTAMMASAVSAAYAVFPYADNTALTTELSDPISGATNTTYTFHGYSTMGSNRNIQSFTYTFPPGTTFTSPTASWVDHTLGTGPHAASVSVSGRQVTVSFNPRIPRDTDYSIVITGVTNGTAGTYTGQTATIFHTNPGGRQEQTDTVLVGDFVISIASILSVTISTSAVAFELYPEIPATPQDVAVTVESSHAFVISRSISGQPELFGLTVNGQAEGAKPEGTATFTDTYSAEAPWTTEGDAVYTATVTYTVVQ